MGEGPLGRDLEQVVRVAADDEERAAGAAVLAAFGVRLAEAGGVEVTPPDVVAPVGRQAVEEAVYAGCQDVDLLARAVADVHLVVAVRQALRIAGERDGERSLEIRAIDLSRIAAPRRLQDIDLAVGAGVDVQAVAA